MKVSISDLWTTQGTVDRGTYALIGSVGFAIKHNLDRIVATTLFDRPWSFFNYLQPGGSLAESSDQKFFATLVLMALPFIWVGVALTLRRLRATGLPLLLVLLFFVPVLNLLFFFVMAVLPSSPARAPDVSEGGEEAEPLTTRIDWRRIVPKSVIGSVALAVGLTAVIGGALTGLAVLGLGEYGLGLFVALPFALGLCSVLLYGVHHSPSLLTALLISVGAVGVLAVLLLVTAVEGALCLLMAAPIGAVLSALGGLMGWAMLEGRRAPQAGVALSVLLLAVPVLMGAEAVSAGVAPLHRVVTTIDVKASPARVWENVVSFSELPPVSDAVLSLGVAYPVRAEIVGSGVGAIRHCIFTTGAFVEPITVWDEPRLLRFDVTAQPPAMKELSPWGDIDAPHLDDYLLSRGGQFQLIPTDDGGTRIEATTWYEHRIRPALYWKQWSDAIMHRIHLRVLKHVKALSEAPLGA